MKQNKQWQDFSFVLREVLQLEFRPVALSCLKAPMLNNYTKQVRICRAIIEAAQGEIIQIHKDNNACFGASWHLGFEKMTDPQIKNMIKKFVVEGEKLFSSYQALDTLLTQMEEPPDNSASYFVLAPLETAVSKPQLVIFVCNPEEACRILTLATFIDGIMPKIKIGGPTCRLAVIYPLLTGEVNLSFYDYTARKMCRVAKDKLLLSIPYNKIPKMIESIEKCSAGTASIEFPQEFRTFLKERLTQARHR